jgi:predicted TIM-barrel fold metal-dependent hydrolase
VRDYRDYVARLYEECGLTALVVDFGYPLPPIDRAEFSKDMPVTIVPIYRIDPLIDELLKEEIGWSEFSRRYDEAIAQAIERDGYRGLKSTIAYCTGLEVSPLSRTQDQGLMALDAIRLYTGGQATKKLLDHLLCRALELCMEFDVPMQIHVGIGDFEINLTRCNPTLLFDLLRFPAYRSARLVLIHCYPFMAEAGYMASMLPRVYCDLSEGVPFAAHAADRIYLTTLEMAPISKVMYGSDGFGLPELSFLGARLGKSALARALSQLVERGFLSLREAEEAAGLILAGNARAFYRID